MEKLGCPNAENRSLGQRPVRPGFNDAYKRTIIRETGNKYLMP